VNKTIRFQVRVNRAEKSLMDAACLEWQLSLSELIRQGTLDLIERELGVTVAHDGSMDLSRNVTHPQELPPPPPV